MPIELIYEHAVPLWAIIGGLALAVTLAAFLFWRYLPLDLTTVGLFVLRLVFMGALVWCLLMPVSKRRVSEVLKPRFLVALDTSGSMALSPDPKNVPARWSVAKTVIEQPWRRNFEGQSEVELYPFGQELGARLGLDGVRDLKPDGASTHLRESLRRMIDRYRGQPLIGVLLLSDGLDTREARDDWAGENWPCPIYTVRLEPDAVWEMEPDVRVDAADTPRRVVVGWESKLTARVSGQGTKGQPLRVQLFKNNVMTQELPTQIPADGGSREVVFQLENPEIGGFTYRVVVPALPGEKQTNDNAYAVSAQVIDAKNRLVYLENVPRWESKYFIRALNQCKTITPLSFLRGPGGKFLTFGSRGDMNLDLTPAQLAGYKVVVLGDLDAEAITDRRAGDLVKFVEEGGSLILLGGPKAWGEKGYAGGPLQKLLPITRAGFPAVQEGKFPAALTPDGVSHPAFAAKDGAGGWDRMPPVLSLFPGAKPGSAAQTLVTAQTPEGVQPLFVVQRYAQGKVCAVLTDSLWRWSLEPGARNEYVRFWNQIMQWLVPEQQEVGKYALDLFSSADNLFLGEPIELNGRLSGPDGQPAQAAGVTAEVTLPDGRTIKFPMSRQTVSTASGKAVAGYGVSMTPEVPGLYKAVAAAEIEGQRVESPAFSYFVKAFNAESTPRPPNVDLLKALAAASGGKFCEPSEVTHVLSMVRISVGEEERVSYKSLWNLWAVMMVLVSLLAVEWAWRRWKNMA